MNLNRQNDTYLTLRQTSFRHLFTLGSLTAFIHLVTVNEEHELFGKE
jgi:hypothetical protein